VRPASPRDEDERGAAGLSGGERGVAELERAGVPARSGWAARAGRRPERGLLESRRAAPLEALCIDESLPEMLRVLDERLRARLAAAFVHRLGLEADVDGEQLPGADTVQRDLDHARPGEKHRRGRARVRIVCIAVDGELVLPPQQTG
jgi:hypothetical protein